MSEQISHTSLVKQYFPNANINQISHILNHHTTFLTSSIDIVEEELQNYILELTHKKTKEKELENKMKGR